MTPPKINFVPRQFRLWAVRGQETRDREAEVTGSFGRMQLMLANLVSSTTRLRTLNIDLGLEASWRKKLLPHQQLALLKQIALNMRLWLAC